MIKNPFHYPIYIWKPAQKDSQIREIKHKVVPTKLKEVVTKSLLHYPELADVYIIVVEKKLNGIQHTLRSYPPLLQLFSKKKDRVYSIVINTNPNIANSFYRLTEEQKIGLLAHEFAHTLDFSMRSSWEIFYFAFFCWLNKRFVRKLEHAIDKTAIARGYGNELFAYRERILEIAGPQMKSYFETIYLRPEEIIEEEEHDNLIVRYHEIIRKSHDKKNYIAKKNSISSIQYALVTTLSFIPEFFQMTYLISIRKMYKKPNWYKK